MDELIVYLCLNLGWTFTEASSFIRETPIKKVNEFVQELQYQKEVENYRIASNFALVIKTWANAQKKGNHYRVSDFIGQPPHRKVDLTEAAKKANIKLPEEKCY